MSLTFTKYHLSIILLLTSLLNYAQDTQPGDTLTAEEKILPVELINISDQSASDIQTLRLDLLSAIQSNVMESVRPELDSIIKASDALKTISDELLEEQNPYEYFEAFSVRWERLEERLSVPKTRLDNYASDLEQGMHQLERMKEKWKLTREEKLEESTSAEMSERVELTLFKMDSVSAILTDSLNNALALQNRLTDINIQVGEYMLNLKQGEQARLNQILTRREHYIWKEFFVEDTTTVSLDNKKILEYNLEDTREFLESERNAFIRLAVFFFLILGAIVWMKTRAEELRAKELSDLNESLKLLENPISLSLMLTFIASATILPLIPYMVRMVYSLIFVIPFMIIYHKMVTSKLRWVLYYFVSIFAATRITSLFFLSVDNNRWVILFESVLISAFFIWFLTHKKQIKSTVGSSHNLYNFINFATPFYVIIVLLSLIANVVGFDNLSQVTNDGVVQSVVIGLILIITYLSLRMLFYLFLKTDLASRSRVIQQFEKPIFIWFQRLLVLSSVFYWFRITLRGFLSWNIFSEWIADFWTEGFQFGELTFTIGGIVTFFFIIIAGWMASRIVEILLREEMLSRFKMPRGIPMAVSSITQYVLVLFAFILAMANMGFDISSLSLLAGALGVGIGFGLQNIVSNFISGLILVFERPITIGDTVTVDNLMGTVTRIGIRASVIKLYDESEVIVPNTELISNKVTNWSLSNNVRRRRIQIHTTIKADPEKVRMLLVNAAKKTDDTLDHPEPQAYFNGIVDQGFQFNLYYWLTKNLFRCDSDVHTNVIQSLKQNKIEFLVPKKLEINEKGTK